MASTFGKIFKITSFGESHGKAIGGVIDGCPAGFKIDISEIQKQLNRRRPGQSQITSQRQESDKVEFLSGLMDDITLGTPIGFIINNADFVYEKKYRLRDHRGGGRSSARETAVRVVAGSIANQIISKQGISIKAFVSKVKSLEITKNYFEYNLDKIDNSIVRCPDKDISNKMISLIKDAKDNGDTLGGEITCIAENVPIGLGEPVFDKLDADLAKAMLSINAVKGIFIGNNKTEAFGSESNDVLQNLDGKTKTNNSGGIVGGISNGNDIFFNVSFKPVSTLMQVQDTINDQGKKTSINPKGRHDPCVLPRAVPIVEAMTAIVLLDHFLINKTNKIL